MACQAAGFLQQPLGKDGSRLHDVLAVVQYEQQVLAGQLVHELILKPPERALAQAGRGGHGPDYRVRLAHRGQVAEADAVQVAVGCPFGYFQGQPGLTHAAWPVQGDQPGPAQPCGHGGQVLVPPDETGHRPWQRPGSGQIMDIRCPGRMPQDVLLDRTQGRGRVQPEFGGQVRSPRPGGCQGVRVAARQVQGPHEQPSRLLTFRVLGQERLQGGDSLLDEAER